MTSDDGFVWCDECLYAGAYDCWSPQLHHWRGDVYCGIFTIDEQLKKDGAV